MDSTRFDRSRSAWWVVVIALGVVVLFAIYAFVGAFVLGLFVYYATRPIYRRVHSHIGQPTLAVATTLLLYMIPILVLITYTITLGIQELSVAGNVGIGNYERLLGPSVNPTAAVQPPQRLFETIRGQLSTVGTGTVVTVLSTVGAYLSAITTALIELFIVLAIAFYLLRDDQKLKAWFLSVVGEGSTAHAFTSAVDRDLKTIYFGNILTAFAVAIVAAITYNILAFISPTGISIPAPTLLGLLTGVGSLIPVIGMKVVYIPVAAYLAVIALVSNPALLWFAVVFLIVAFVVIDTIPELLLRPYLSGRDLHVGLVMIAYIIGPLLFGWYGLFLAPFFLVLIVQAALLVLPALVHGEEILPDFATPELFESDMSPGADPRPEANPAGDGSGEPGDPAPNET